jgi:predicted enzyme related to lactoylglutathione lyase
VTIRLAPDFAVEAARLEKLGARRVSTDTLVEHDHRWIVMADPNGNEFCVVQRPD